MSGSVTSTMTRRGFEPLPTTSKPMQKIERTEMGKKKPEPKGKKAKGKAKQKSPKKPPAKSSKPKKATLRERRDRAAVLFSQGYNVTDVAREMGVSRTTATDYKKRYEESLAQEVKDNPGFLRDAVANTVRTLRELDEIRKNAWNTLNDKLPRSVETKCPNCGEMVEHEYRDAPSDQTRTQMLNVLLKSGEQRAKLFGLLGVKQEVLIEIQSVNIVQNRIMAWLTENLQGDQREALASFVEVELAPFIRQDDGPMPVIEASVITELAGVAEPEALPVE